MISPPLLFKFKPLPSPLRKIFEKDVAALVEEMEFMYGYDQLLRENLIFKSFNKSETDSIEILPDSLRSVAMKEHKFMNDSLGKIIYRDYINPKDAMHTARIREITKKIWVS